jgi:ZIP family zinc transporter
MGEVGQSLHPVYQALLATGFTWVMTLLGAAGVFLGREVSRRAMDGALGFAAGVMIAASSWSLLAPAIQMRSSGLPAWLPVAIGFLAGGAFLRMIDALLPHLHLGLPLEHAEGIKTSWQRSTLLVIAITLHNIPEGLAIGVRYGSVGGDIPSASLGSATALAIGIGIQSLPEGLAVSLPLRREGSPR